MYGQMQMIFLQLKLKYTIQSNGFAIQSSLWTRELNHPLLWITTLGVGNNGPTTTTFILGSRKKSLTLNTFMIQITWMILHDHGLYKGTVMHWHLTYYKEQVRLIPILHLWKFALNHPYSESFLEFWQLTSFLLLSFHSLLLCLGPRTWYSSFRFVLRGILAFGVSCIIWCTEVLPGTWALLYYQQLGCLLINQNTMHYLGKSFQRKFKTAMDKTICYDDSTRTSCKPTSNQSCTENEKKNKFHKLNNASSVDPTR